LYIAHMFYSNIRIQESARRLGAIAINNKHAGSFEKDFFCPVFTSFEIPSPRRMFWWNQGASAGVKLVEELPGCEIFRSLGRYVA
jgi:hypothetical protein